MKKSQTFTFVCSMFALRTFAYKSCSQDTTRRQIHCSNLKCGEARRYPQNYTRNVLQLVFSHTVYRLVIALNWFCWEWTTSWKQYFLSFIILSFNERNLHTCPEESTAKKPVHENTAIILAAIQQYATSRDPSKIRIFCNLFGLFFFVTRFHHR